jgi:hypothetical protein
LAKPNEAFYGNDDSQKEVFNKFFLSYYLLEFDDLFLFSGDI